MNEEAVPSIDVRSSKSDAGTAKSLGPVGLGGWLILPFLHLGFSFVLTAYNLFQLLDNYDGLVAIVTGGSDKLEALRLPMALSALGGLLIFVLAPAGFYAMLIRSVRAPKIMITFYLANCIAAGLDVLADRMMSPILNEPTDTSLVTHLPQSIFWCFVWITYFIRSRRVANTFRPHEAALGEKVSETFA